MEKSETLAERVQFLINSNNLSVTAAAQKCGVPQPRLNDIVSGKTKNPHSGTIDKIARGFEVRAGWLLTGEGEMYENLPDGGDGPEPGTLIYYGDLLVKTVIAVENLIREQKADLPPEDRAKLIEIIYEMSLYRKHLMDNKEIRKILKLVG